MNRAVIALNNFRMRLRRRRFRPADVLLLFSSCLQRSACECNIKASLDNCRRCGQCAVAKFLDLGDELGVRVFLATGGRLAAQQARDPKVKAIVAVACRKELGEGIKAVFPKPVLVREIRTPHGFCVDTEIDFDRVREAVLQLLE